jgi:TetR/AcrR family transcriptional regulator of autoinduction and epiphytic fitness
MQSFLFLDEHEMPLTLSQRKRLAIIEAAIVEFQLQGYTTASMDSVAARADVSKRTVYNHFASKDALFAELVSQMLEMGSQATRYVYQPNKTITTQLTEFGMQEIALLQDTRFMSLSRITMAQAMHSPDQAKSIMSEINHQENHLERWISAAIEDTKVKPVSSAYAARQFLGLIKAVAFWPQMLTSMPTLEDAQALTVVEDAVGMFVSHYAL